MTTYLTNAFSLQMIEAPVSIKVEEVTADDIKFDVSGMGHPDIANVTSHLIGTPVPVNRCNIKLNPGDVLFVAQFTGGRLPEGTTELPPGFSVKFLKVTTVA